MPAYPIRHTTWHRLVRSFKATKASLYLPEYSDGNERSLNYRYYR